MMLYDNYCAGPVSTLKCLIIMTGSGFDFVSAASVFYLW